MKNKHLKFDEAKLFDRKNNFCGFRFCPLCGKSLTRGQIEGQERVYCPDESCGFIFYQNPVPAAGAILVESNQVLLVKRAHPPRIGWWCLPAGFMDWQEHPSETAVREVEEETGLKIELLSFFEVYSGKDDPRSNAILLLYLGQRVGGQLQANDDAEEVCFFPLDDLPERIAFESHVRALNDYQGRFGPTDE